MYLTFVFNLTPDKSHNNLCIYNECNKREAYRISNL